MPATPPSLFPPIQPIRHGMLAVDELHTIYWEEVGNPNGIPVLFLHGGPGAGLSPQHRRFFDPHAYRVIVFGGSWGSTLALAYGQAHPERCLGFVLRGIFLCTQAEVDWFLHGVQWFYPELYEEFIAPIPPAERGELLQAYARRLLCDDPAVYWPAARAWSRFEGRRVFLLPQEEEQPSDTLDLGVGRLEAHYMANGAFLSEDQLVRNIGRIAHLPAVIVQGRYDVICPPLSAHRLHAAWPGAKLRMIPDAGHGALETGIARALVAATEQFKRNKRFD
jgi:proline iminopeptidase